jgi:5-methylcytosine-specific restriction protein A
MQVCAEPRCPHPAVHRGRCQVHRRSESERGYGPEWRRLRAIVRVEEPACRRCGSTVLLTVDHIVPRSLGGTDARSNLRTLCRACHARYGLQRNRRGAQAVRTRDVNRDADDPERPLMRVIG